MGHTLPSILQALIYINSIQVDLLTLVLLITASVLGAAIGAKFVVRLPKRKIQLGMGIALLAAAAFVLVKQLSGFRMVGMIFS